jgi:hypothetical protein
MDEPYYISKCPGATTVLELIADLELLVLTAKRLLRHDMPFLFDLF